MKKAQYDEHQIPQQLIQMSRHLLGVDEGTDVSREQYHQRMLVIKKFIDESLSEYDKKMKRRRSYR